MTHWGMIQHELQFHNSGILGEFAGVDEVGRGPLAGPVVAAAVVIKDIETFVANWPPKLAKVGDSKSVSKKNLEKIYTRLTNSEHVGYGVGIVTVEEIDNTNILKSALKAMELAVANLPRDFAPGYILIDGNRIPSKMMTLASGEKAVTEFMIRGDARCYSVGAASIIAKVTRDRIMRQIGADYPGYDLHKNSGYGTRVHMMSIVELGPTPWHRQSFNPIKGWLANASTTPWLWKKAGWVVPGPNGTAKPTWTNWPAPARHAPYGEATAEASECREDQRERRLDELRLDELRLDERRRDLDEISLHEVGP